MTCVLSIDPGPVQSAYLLYDAQAPQTYPVLVPEFGIVPNEVLKQKIWHSPTFLVATALVVESVESYGMPVGREVFETIFWCGRFVEAWGPLPHTLMPRREVKQHCCRSVRANDAMIRQALLDLFGGSQRAVGVNNKKRQAPGPLYGIRRDVWSCLALAVTYVAHGSVASGPCLRCGWGEASRTLAAYTASPLRDSVVND